MKTAVVLFNLGGPGELNAVQPFLFNIFNDYAIISLPQPLRWLIAKFISFRRTTKAKLIYSSIGGRSPILENTLEQALSLEKELSFYGEYKVFVSMRYWHPMSQEVLMHVHKYNPDKVILLPLYPQFSSTTTASSFKDWREQANNIKFTKPTVKVDNYYNHPGFIFAYATLTKAIYDQASKNCKVKILFSAHGIPLSRIKKGDPYHRQVEQSVQAVIKAMNIHNLEHTICFQSRVGPLKWLTPDTSEEIIKASAQKFSIVLVPISFVSEHSETLYELDIEYKALAEKHGCKGFFRVPALGVNPTFIKGLADLILGQGKCFEKEESESQ